MKKKEDLGPKTGKPKATFVGALSSLYEPLRHSLLFFFGEAGWSPKDKGAPQEDAELESKAKKTNVKLGDGGPATGGPDAPGRQDRRRPSGVFPRGRQVELPADQRVRLAGEQGEVGLQRRILPAKA